MSSKAEKLAKKIFKAKNIKEIIHGEPGFEKKYKIIVFMPGDKTDELTFAMANAGAGIIGNYTLCSFRTHGTGTFMGNDSSNPVMGTKGKFETADEIKLEMICDKENIEGAIEQLYSVHPYDEPAFEIYEVLTRKRKRDGDIISVILKKKLPVKNFVKMINNEIDTSNIPRKFKKIKIGKGIIDCSDNVELNLKKYQEKLLYIKSTNNNIKAYLT